MIVIVVPSEAANDSGISSLDGGDVLLGTRQVERDRQHDRRGGHVVREGRKQRDRRHDHARARYSWCRPARPTQPPTAPRGRSGEIAALSTKIAATTIAGSLPNPAKASSGFRTPRDRQREDDQRGDDIVP